MDLEDLAAVQAVVHQGTFSAAAVSLKVAQPALSRRIQRLERELGGLLFDRLPRHAAATPLGDAVANAAAAILNEVESARADAMAIARGAAGRIRMSSLAGGIPALARGLSLFQQRHPEVVVELRALDAEAAVHALRERRVDLATLPGSAVEPGLRARKLARWRVVLAVRPDHPFARKSAVPISALEDQPLLMLAPEFMVSRHVMDLAERTGVRLQPRLATPAPKPCSPWRGARGASAYSPTPCASPPNWSRCLSPAPARAPSSTTSSRGSPTARSRLRPACSSRRW